MNKKNTFGAGLVVIVIFLTQFLIKKFENYSITMICVGLFIIFSGFIVSILMIKNRKKMMGLKFNMIIAILAPIACTVIGAMLIIIKIYPQFGDEYPNLLKVIAIIEIGSFFILMGAIIVGSAKYLESKNR